MENKKISEKQLKAIRRNYAIRARKAKKETKAIDNERVKNKKFSKSESCSIDKLNNYTKIASDFAKDKSSKKKLSDYAKKNLKIKNDSIDPKILDNNWNIHHARTDRHPKAVLTRNNDEFLIAHTTTESKDKDAKIKIQDGLFDNQKENTFVKLSIKPISKKQLQSKIKNSRITNRDKLYIYDSIKDRETNKIKYKNLGKKKDRI